MTTSFNKDQSLPTTRLAWKDGDGNLIDYSAGYTFTAKLCVLGSSSTIAYTKSAGITGAAGAVGPPLAPNVVIAWAASDFAGLVAGTIYTVTVYANQTATGKNDVFSPGNLPQIQILAAPA